MPEPLDITSGDNPRIKAVVRLREHKERRVTGLFVAEGVREISRALGAGLAPVSVFACPALLGLAHLREVESSLPGLVATHAGIYGVTEPLFHKMAYCNNPEGVLAVFEQRRWSLADFPSPPDPPPPAGPAPAPELWLVAVGTQKPGNLGAMVRSADGAGATGVLVADGVVDAFNPNAIRASTGAVFSFPILGGAGEEILGFLAGRGTKVFAATPDRGVPYTQVNLAQPAAIVIGPEDAGLGPRWMDAAAARIAIPMHGKTVDSLNASVAATVLLFEARRQRDADKRTIPP